MKRILSALALIALTATVSSAQGSFLALQFMSGTADLAIEDGLGYAAAYDHSEWGGRVEFWNMMSEDYAFNLSATYSAFGEENKPGVNSTPGDPVFRYTQNAWAIRAGGDRVVRLGDRSYLFFGPGIEYWTGKATFEFETAPTVTVEGENVSRISLSGRIGAHMMIGENWGLTLQGGHKLGYASYEEQGAKSTWWPSSMDASGGLLFRFGAQ